jgi:ribose 5-phosphate isomerase B
MLYLGADHNGYLLKEGIKADLKKSKSPVFDCGADKYRKTDDYVDYAAAVCKRLKPGDLGVLCCGSGHGMVISANKFKGVRAILADSRQSAFLGRRDDHANVLVLAAWSTTQVSARRILKAFLSTRPGSAVRYLRRLKKVKSLEK